MQPAAVHRIEGELDPEVAAAQYDEALRGVRLRLNIVGIGPDGHAASLFPNAPGLHERERLAIAAEPGLEPFVPRVTMTPPMLGERRLRPLPRHRRAEGGRGQAGVRGAAERGDAVEPDPL